MVTKREREREREKEKKMGFDARCTDKAHTITAQCVHSIF